MQLAASPGYCLSRDILKSFVLRRLQTARRGYQDAYYNNIIPLHDFLEKDQTLSPADQDFFYNCLCQLLKESLDPYDAVYIEDFTSQCQGQTQWSIAYAVTELFNSIFIDKKPSWLKIATIMEIVAAIIIRDVKNLALVHFMATYFECMSIDDERGTINTWIDAHAKLTKSICLNPNMEPDFENLNKSRKRPSSEPSLAKASKQQVKPHMQPQHIEIPSIDPRLAAPPSRNDEPAAEPFGSSQTDGRLLKIGNPKKSDLSSERLESKKSPIFNKDSSEDTSDASSQLVSSEKKTNSVPDKSKPHPLASLVNFDKLYIRARAANQYWKETLFVFGETNDFIEQVFILEVKPSAETALLTDLKGEEILTATGGLENFCNAMLLSRPSRSSNGGKQEFAKIDGNGLENLTKTHQVKMIWESVKTSEGYEVYISKEGKTRNRSLERLCKVFTDRSLICLEFIANAQEVLTHAERAIIVMAMVKLYYSMYELHELPKPVGYVWELEPIKVCVPEPSTELLSDLELPSLRLHASIKDRDGFIFLDALNPSNAEIKLILALNLETAQLFCLEPYGNFIFSSKNINDRFVTITDNKNAEVGSFGQMEPFVNFWIEPLEESSLTERPSSTQCKKQTERGHTIYDTNTKEVAATIEPEETCVLVSFSADRLGSEHALILAYAALLAMCQYKITEQILGTHTYHFPG